MERKLIDVGNSKGLTLPSDIFANIEKVNFEIDTKKKKIEITWE
jgi:hypothetical protein